jgi:hypothetical protein
MGWQPEPAASSAIADRPGSRCEDGVMRDDRDHTIATATVIRTTIGIR